MGIEIHQLIPKLGYEPIQLQLSGVIRQQSTPITPWFVPGVRLFVDVIVVSDFAVT
jgi:hypothetical protein